MFLSLQWLKMELCNLDAQDQLGIAFVELGAEKSCKCNLVSSMVSGAWGAYDLEI